MSEQQVKKSASSDIDTIRDILMGQHIAEYQSMFEQIQQTHIDFTQANAKNLEELEQRTNQRLDDLQKMLEHKIDQLTNHTNKHLDDLAKKLEEVSREDKNQLAQMLSQVASGLASSKS